MNLSRHLECAVLLAVIQSVAALAQDGAWHQESNHRWRELEVSAKGKTGFTKLAPAQTGLLFTNLLTEPESAANRVLQSGSGVAVGDFDNDGLPDVFFCGLHGNVLFKNLGNWRFKDVTQEAGLRSATLFFRGAVFADLNGDHWQDLLVSATGKGVFCYLNDGHGKFIDSTSNAGTRSTMGSTTLALADVDGNGTLDLYVTNNRDEDIRDRGRVNLPMVRGRPVIPPQFKDRLLYENGQLLEYGHPSQLLLNDGTGKFRQVSWTNGAFLNETGQRLTGPPLDWGFTATFRDVNEDGFPDLYVCNDYWTPDRFWINDGRGHFRAIDPLALRKISSSSMGVDFADVDHDGFLDFVVVDMLSPDSRLRKRQRPADRVTMLPVGVVENRPQVMRNTFYQNRGDGTYAELADFSGLSASDWSWSPIFLDVDLDGYEDLLVSAGHFRDVQDLDAERLIQSRQHSWNYTDEAARQKAFTAELMEHYRLYPHLSMQIKAYRNARQWRFEEKTAEWGTDDLGVHHGMALGDLDQDGDLDLVVNNLDAVAGVYRNDSTEPRVAVQLRGLAPNSHGIGARVTLLNGAVPKQSAEIVSGGRYVSGSQEIVVFGAGKTTQDSSLEVRWRNGSKTVVRSVRPNCLYEINEKGAVPAAPATVEAKSSLFADASQSISHNHFETEFNDFERQPLLPFKFSQAGPGTAWFDLNGDGHDDLFIGAGRGGKLAAYVSDGRGSFSRIESAAVFPDDMAGLAGWVDQAGKRFLIGILTGYEQILTNAAVMFQLQSSNLVQVDARGVEIKAGSSLALGPSDRPNSLALFVAGGALAGNYPQGAASALFRFEGDRWRQDVRNSALLEHLGIVNAAIWSDLNGDGIPELILACEWGPIRVFRFENGLLFEAGEKLGLSKHTGWWKGVTTGDFDSDGRLDIVASNWGLNSPYQATPERPLTFFYGTLARPGVVDILDAEYDASGQLAPRRLLHDLAGSLPFLLETFGSFKQFSEASAQTALGERIVLARQIAVNTLASMLFLNRGDRFEAVELPREAQLAPAFGLNVADFDGDGHEDIFLSQNFFATAPHLPRLDAGRGLLLRGDGTGKLFSVPGGSSGIKVYGEQRSSAVGDFNEDGRPDLVVTQNGTRTILYKNQNAKPGLRVLLQGPSANPQSIGAVLRIQFEKHFGPAREIHAGSGYWSYDSQTQVLGTPSAPVALQVQWPGGSKTMTPIPPGAKEITVDNSGKIVRSL